MQCYRCGREDNVSNHRACGLCRHLFCSHCLVIIGMTRGDGLRPGTYCRTCLGQDRKVPVEEQLAALPWPLMPDKVYIMCVRTERGTIGRTIQWITRHASSSYMGARGWALLSPHAHLGPYAHMAILSTWRRSVALCAWAPAGGAPAPGTVYEATEKGFVATPLDHYHTEGTFVDVFEVCDLDQGAAFAIAERCETMAALGIHYDFAQLVGVGIGRFIWGAKRLRITNLFGRKRLICSEAVAIILRDCSGINVCGRYHVSVYTPTDIRHTCDNGQAKFVATIDWQPRVPGITSRAAAQP